MPIKKLRVSFDLDVELFAKILAHGNNGMHIDVLGDATEAPRVTHTAASRRGEHPAKKQMAVLEALKNGQQELSVMKAKVKEEGFSPDVNSLVSKMLEDKLIKRVGYALYTLTEKGRSYVDA
jgi:hypothetical protein